MNIFLRRIPANTRHSEITEFISPALKSGFFLKPGRIVDVQILALQDSRFGSMEYHGLVTLDSELTVQRVIKGLKNRRFNGRMVVVRPYYHRSWYNDPRQHQRADNEFVEKRKGDRRRGKFLQVVKNASDRFNSEDDFVNTLQHQQFSISFVVPGDMEAAVMECLDEFETMRLNGDAAGHKIVKLPSEHDEAEPRNTSFQIYSEKIVISALLERLKSEFAGSGIHYWIMPVVEKGEI